MIVSSHNHCSARVQDRQGEAALSSGSNPRQDAGNRPTKPRNALDRGSATLELFKPMSPSGLPRLGAGVRPEAEHLWNEPPGPGLVCSSSSWCWYSSSSWLVAHIGVTGEIAQSLVALGLTRCAHSRVPALILAIKGHSTNGITQTGRHAHEALSLCLEL